MDIKSLINKVIASKGILRVPSWWMKKLLTEIVEYIDSGDSATESLMTNMSKNASLAGIAAPSTNPGIPDSAIFYFASQAGIYENFDGIIVDKDQFVILHNIGGAWEKNTLIMEFLEKLKGIEEGAQVNDVFISDSLLDSYDLVIADEKGNIILGLRDGEIITKNFCSSDISDAPTISGIPEAPKDGKTYGRNNGEWNAITSSGESYLGSIEYTGQKIVFPKMNYKRLGTLPNNQQCCMIHNNLAIFVNGTKYWVTDKNDSFNVLKAGDVGVTGVHSNIGSLGTEFYNGNTIPLIYLTDWDGAKGVKVFNLNDENYTMSHLQSIVPSSELLQSNIFGLGNTDFIVDKENGFLYSICYKENTWMEIETNKTCICKFALPRLSEGNNITLGLDDIIDHFEVENIPTRQDCCIYNGILYIENGYVTPYYKATLRAIDLSKKEVVSKIDISKIVDGEPECLEFDEDHLLMVYGKPIYGLYF